jgi:putative transcriptional regulator
MNYKYRTQAGCEVVHNSLDDISYGRSLGMLLGNLKFIVFFSDILSTLLLKGVDLIMAFGLGKPRSKLGRFLDRNKITQEKIRSLAGIDRTIMAEICGSEDYNPHMNTRIKLIGSLRKLGYDVRMDDFW